MIMIKYNHETPLSALRVFITCEHYNRPRRICLLLEPSRQRIRSYKGQNKTAGNAFHLDADYLFACAFGRDTRLIDSRWVFFCFVFVFCCFFGLSKAWGSSFARFVALCCRSTKVDREDNTLNDL